jgi:hypothetical protein
VVHLLLHRQVLLMFLLLQVAVVVEAVLKTVEVLVVLVVC